MQEKTTQIYVRARDKRRLARLAKREGRAMVDQLEVILDEACDRRGIDRITCREKHDQ